MKIWKKITAICLALCVLLSALPVVASAVDGSYTYTQLGNSGAVMEFPSAVTSATVDDETLATVSVSGKMVTVTGAPEAVGVAAVTVAWGGTAQTIEVPIGYTTFLFEGDRVTVYEGSNTNYEVAGINAADKEYLEDDADYPLPVSTDEAGNKVYENTADYSIVVSVKKKGGTYVFAGQSGDMAIAVKKEATAPAELLLCGLDLTSSLTAPITVKKNSESTVTITALAGHVNTLTDQEFNNADNYGDTEDGGDGTNVEYAESAVIKGKAYADITLNGSGTLNLVCNTKNAVKVGEYGSLTIADLALNVTSARNGISSDNTMTIQSGTLDLNVAADGIRSDPDAVDAQNGCIGNITIEGGSITIASGSDGIQAAQDLTVTGGSFDITAGAGYDDPSFDKDTMSCKGLKASYNVEDEDADTSEATNTITITGGQFRLNTADDAIHSDANILITGGEYDIWTGDDGVHGDTTLTLGQEDGGDCAIHMTVHASYEGLEAGNVYIYSGCYDVTASDDGINAAGGSDATDDNMGFNPGWGGNAGSSEYSLNILGGVVKVNADSDGLDSNGTLNLTGGTTVVWGASAGDGEPLDHDGTMTISGATVFAAGGGMMMSGGTSQYLTSSNTRVSSGQTINVQNNGTTVFNVKAVKSASYLLFACPEMTSKTGWSFVVDHSELLDASDWVEHAWDGGTVITPATETTPGEMRYTCGVCGAVKTEEIPVLPGETEEPTDPEETEPTTPEETTGPEETEPTAPEETTGPEETEPTAPEETTDPTEDPGTEEQAPKPSFTDLVPGAYYEEAVLWAVEEGIAKGMTTTTFEPGQKCTRAQVVTFLWRAAGEPEPASDQCPFVDVKADSYYYEAMLWAVEEGIAKGMDTTHFCPGEPCTRAQVAAFLRRMLGSPEPSVTETPFTDIVPSAWYYDDVLWAYGAKVTDGMTVTAFWPSYSCTRGQIVTFLYRALVK